MNDLFRWVNQKISMLIRWLQLMRQTPQAEVKPSLAYTFDAQSVLMSDVMVEGELHCDQNIMVDGQFKGTVAAENNTVAIGPNALVYADISANTVVIEGAVKGDIKAETRVVLSPSGRVSGNIYAAVVKVEHGARFKGVIEIDPPHEEVVDVSEEQALKVESVAMEPS